MEQYIHRSLVKKNKVPESQTFPQPTSLANVFREHDQYSREFFGKHVKRAGGLWSVRKMEE
jgi:hypothetical protein